MVARHLVLHVADQVVDLAARLQLTDVCLRALGAGFFLIESKDAQPVIELAPLQRLGRGQTADDAGAVVVGTGDALADRVVVGG